MQAIEAIPVFRTRPGLASGAAAKEAAPTFSLDFDDALTDPAPPVDTRPPAPLPPMRNHTGKPALSSDLWADTLATFAEAIQAQRRLSVDYGTALGQDQQTGLFHVRCPGWQWLKMTA